jgi:predicted nucleic acid-binding Zn ribbon protein
MGMMVVPGCAVKGVRKCGLPHTCAPCAAAPQTPMSAYPSPPSSTAPQTRYIDSPYHGDDGGARVCSKRCGKVWPAPHLRLAPWLRKLGMSAYPTPPTSIDRQTRYIDSPHHGDDGGARVCSERCEEVWPAPHLRAWRRGPSNTHECLPLPSLFHCSPNPVYRLPPSWGGWGAPGL